MPRAFKACSTPSCPELVPTGTGRCDDCTRDAEHARGTAHARGYGPAHRRRFRRAVLDRDPICTRCERAPSAHADHWPHSRRDLEAHGEDPNDPKHGRGLCASCHSTETTKHQPGGWNAH